MKRAVAGPTLRALVAAVIGRMFIQCGDEAGIADYGRSGVSKDEIKGVQFSADNLITVESKAVRSRINWEVAHSQWTLRFVERRQMDGNGAFVKSAPYQISLLGDLLEAARFLGIARTMFLDALRADGWSPADVAIEGLRWIDTPYSAEIPHLRLMLQGT